MKNVEMEIDSHKLIYHPERVAQWKKGLNPSPIYVEIGLTNKCNLRCSFCALDFINTNKSNKDFLNKKVMLDTLEDMGRQGVKSVMFAGEGESTLHPSFVEFVKAAKHSGMDVAVTTNGIVLKKEELEEVLPSLSWIRYSLNAATPETYISIHGIKNKKIFDIVIQNIKDAVGIKKTKKIPTTIGVQFLLLPQNKHEVTLMAKYCSEWGVDNLQIKPYSQHPDSINKQEIDYSNCESIKAELAKFDSETMKVIYRSRSMTKLTEPIPYRECEGVNFFTLIDAKGNVIPCNIFYNKEEFYYGNIYQKKFSEIWNGERRQKVLAMLKERGCEQCRKSCRLDEVNRYLERLKNPQLHDNFI